MAIMIPPGRPSATGGGKKAEQALWDALRHRLSDEWYVYYSLDYVDRRAFEGEADFLLLHREHGMFAVECKGSGVRRGPDGLWYRGSSRMGKSPFDQAQKTIKGIAFECEARMPAVNLPKKLFFVHGHGVVFPTSREERVLPLAGQGEMVAFATDLDRIDEWVKKLAAFWSQGTVPRAPSESDFKRFRTQVLHPEIQFVETLSSRIDADEAALARVTEEQAQVLSRVFSSPRARVSGAAGTGKTVVAMEVARQIAAQPGKRVLVACYNSALARHLWQHVEAWGKLPGTVEVRTFHALCRLALQELARPHEPPEGREEAIAFWEETAPAALLDALAEEKLPPFDAIVLDEAQDFQEEWLSVLEELLVDKDKGRFAVFYDPVQGIFGRKAGFSNSPPTGTLTVNFRNTKAIAEVVRQLGQVDVISHPQCPQGEAPTVYPNLAPAKVRSRVDELVRKLIEKDGIGADRITVLTPHRRQNSSLAEVETLGGVAVAERASDRKGKVLHTTIGGYKGLESDVVILVDVDPKDERCDRKARYVAASRAKHVLCVFSRGDWLGR